MSHSCPVLTIHDMVSGAYILSKIELVDTAGDDAAYITPLTLATQCEDDSHPVALLSQL